MWCAAFSVRALYHHLVCAHAMKLNKCIFTGRARVSHPELRRLIMLYSPVALRQVFKVRCFIKEQQADRVAPINMKHVKVKDAGMTVRGQRSNVKGAAEVQG